MALSRLRAWNERAIVSRSKLRKRPVLATAATRCLRLPVFAPKAKLVPVLYGPGLLKHPWSKSEEPPPAETDLGFLN
jgi:hypothetical protein